VTFRLHLDGKRTMILRVLSESKHKTDTFVYYYFGDGQGYGQTG
jgi:hypothetical protein